MQEGDIIFKLFKTPKFYYLYDRNTNSTIRIAEEAYNVLQNYSAGSKDYNDIVNGYQKKGYLLPSEVKKIEHPKCKVLQNCLSDCIEQLTLQVTQNCNLRCEYCVYSGNYDNRTHSNRNMDFSTAKKAMDLLIRNSAQNRKLVLGFYGGEPLLNLGLIKKCVEYMESNVEGKILEFAVTTNGTLLTSEITKYLFDHKFHVLISLDGSKNEHDKNRKFINGEGSFDIIMDHLYEIRRTYPELFKKIRFNTVVNPNHDYLDIKRYFETDEIMEEASIGLNVVEAIHNKKDINFGKEFFIVRQFDYLKGLLWLIGKLDESHVSKLIMNNLLQVNTNYKESPPIIRTGKVAHHNGPCVPGAKRLFISVDGKLFPCERVPETCDEVCIGTIDTGIDVERARNILNIGKISQNECISCWALLRCSMCVSHVVDGDKLTYKKKIKQCIKSKRTALNDLIEICALKEFGYNFREKNFGGGNK